MLRQCKIVPYFLSYQGIKQVLCLTNFLFRELTKSAEILTIMVKSLFGHTMW